MGELIVHAPNQHLDVLPASWAGQSLAVDRHPFEDPDGDGIFELKHPITEEQLKGSDGDHLLIWTLPVGSYQQSSPPLDVDIPFLLKTTSPDVLRDDINVTAGGGYRYGSDPRDNANPSNPLDPQSPFDPVIPATTDAWVIHPVPVLLDKETDAHEDETATGPNFPKSWRLDVDLADDQTIDPLELKDTLPDDLYFLGDNPVEINRAQALYDYAPPRPFQVKPGQIIKPPLNRWGGVDYFKAFGSSDSIDLRARLDFYVPRVLAPDGQPKTYHNQSSLNGTWSNIDPQQPIAIDDQATTDKITARSLAIQKTDDKPETLLPNGKTLPGTIRPGEDVEFTLNFQVSDYFSFGGLVVTDRLHDGLVYEPGSARIELWEEGRKFSAGPVAFEDALITQRPDFNQDGDDELVFRLSDWLRSHSQALGSADLHWSDGLLIGGKVIGDFGATRGRIIFQAKAEDQYFSGGSVKSEDRLHNTVDIGGDVFEYDKKTSSFRPTSFRVSDTSVEHLRIPAPVLDKALVARNGQPIQPDAMGDLVFAPGDTVTYEITAQFPTGDLQNVEIVDWLPTPGFDLGFDAKQVAGSDSFEQGTGPYPDAGQFVYGDRHGVVSGDPAKRPALLNDAIKVDARGGVNVLKAHFVDQSDLDNQPTTLQFLYTVTATSAVMTDRLDQTNLAQLSFESSRTEGMVLMEISIRSDRPFPLVSACRRI